MALTTLDAVAEMLRWNAAEKTKYTSQIAPYIAAAGELVESAAGPFEERTVVHVADGGDVVILPTRVTAVTGITVDGVAFTDWTLERAAGIVRGPFAEGSQNVTVTYTTGYEAGDIPAAAKLAATMIAVDKWAIASQRAPRLGDQVDPTYLLPKVVRELLAPFQTMPGFA